MGRQDAESGRSNNATGHEFERKVSELYELLGFRVEREVDVCGTKVDILASKKVDGSEAEHRVIVECKSGSAGRAQNQVVNQFSGLFRMAREDRVADSAEIITASPWGPTAKRVAKKAGIGLYTFKEKLSKLMDFSSYIDRVIYDFEHYEEYVSADREPLKHPIIDAMTRSDLFRTYVPLRRRVPSAEGNATSDDLDSYIEVWLTDEHRHHLSILGDFGTGKSSFSLHLTYELAKRYRGDPINNRIPLLVSLRDYVRAVSLEQLITNLLLNRYSVRMESYAQFQRFLEAGFLVLIFDGFDEMASKTDKRLTMRNFDELAKAAVAGSKTILTCRTHYFVDGRHIDDTLGGGTELLAAVQLRPTFSIIELAELSDEQIKLLLRLHCPDDWAERWADIRRNLYDLARRPLLLDMIVKTLAKPGSVIPPRNTAELYGRYTSIWAGLDDYRTRMSVDGKQEFMEELAVRMWLDNTQAIHYRYLKDRIQSWFKDGIKTSDDLDEFDHDVRTCSFLNNDRAGNYRFIHTSFKEFFVARRMFCHVQRNEVDSPFREKDLTPEMCSFLAELVSADVVALNNLCEWAFDNTRRLAWNAINVLAFVKGLRPADAVERLLRLCRKKELRSGVTWVLGELGESNDEVIALLKNALSDPEHPSRWWEAAFALEKLGAAPDPIAELADTLSADWTYEAGLSSLAKAVAANSRDGAQIDQRAVVAVIRESREPARSREDIAKDVERVFSPLDLGADEGGRRCYYAVWLFGELRVASMLAGLLAAVKHPQAAVRNMLAEAVGKIGDAAYGCPSVIGADALDALGVLLVHGYYRTRFHAAQSIGKIKAESLLPALRDALEREPLRDVQNEMSSAIGLVEGMKRQAMP